MWSAVKTTLVTVLAVVGPYSCLSPGTAYPTVKFTTKNATKETYSRFILALFNHVPTDEPRHGVRVLRNASTVPDSERFLLVQLSNSYALGESVTIALDVTRLYFVAYRVGGRSYFFSDAAQVAGEAALSNLFAGTDRDTLPFSTHYDSLQRTARHRSSITLGIHALTEAVSSLRESHVYRRRNMAPIARASIIIIQMVSEAMRFPYIHQLVRRHIVPEDRYRSFLPDNLMLRLENSWGALSERIFYAHQGGEFSGNRSIDLPRSGFDVDIPLVSQTEESFTVRHVIPSLTAFIFIRRRGEAGGYCRPRRSVDFYSVGDDGNPDSLTGISVVDGVCVVGDDNYIFENPEPTLRIIGRDGLCATVKTESYYNGDAIVLDPCDINTPKNQLWSLMLDGTIRSNGKCLTANGRSAQECSPGDYVMIYDCPNPVTERTRWEILDDGTIMNPHSKLVLTAKTGGSELSVETNTYASSQGWTASSVTEPFFSSIAGYDDLCLQANADAVWLEECDGGEINQKWALYGDGTLRPPQNQGSCLTYNDDEVIYLGSCNSASPRQRWVFTSDGTIQNLESKMVMDVRQSKPSLKQIIVFQFYPANLNQRWFLLF